MGLANGFMAASAAYQFQVAGLNNYLNTVKGQLSTEKATLDKLKNALDTAKPEYESSKSAYDQCMGF